MVSPRRRRHLQTRGGAAPSISTSDVLAEATRRGIRTTPGKITLVSNDGRAFVVDQAVAYRFETLRGMEADDTELVPISGANGQILGKALDYATFYASHRAPVESEAFDTAFVDDLTDETLFGMMAIVNFLDYNDLLVLLSKQVALRIAEEWPDSEAVKRALHITTPFTQDEYINAHEKTLDHWIRSYHS